MTVVTEQTAACVPVFNAACLSDHVAADLDRPWVLARGILAAASGVLVYTGLAELDPETGLLPTPQFIEVGIAPTVPQAAVGGKGCHGLVVGIGTLSTPVKYEGGEPTQSSTPFEFRQYFCRASDSQEVGYKRPRLGDLDGSDINSVTGVSLDTSRHYAAYKAHLIAAIRGLDSCPTGLDCSTISNIVFGIGILGACNYVSVKFSARI